MMPFLIHVMFWVANLSTARQQQHTVTIDGTELLNTMTMILTTCGGI